MTCRRDVSDILDDLADSIAKLSNRGTPIVIAGDFNCRIDSGTRGHELTSALSDIGFTCHNDPAHHTYISKQGVSTIDLVFTDSVSVQKFRMDVRPALGTKHQHVSVVFDDQLDKYDTRCDKIRRVDYATLGRKCDIGRIQESLTAGGDLTDRVDAAYGVITEAIASAAIESKTRKSKKWFDSECYVMKTAVKKSYIEWRVNGDAASRDCHAENVTSFQRLKWQKKREYEDNMINAQISRAESSVSGFWKMWKTRSSNVSVTQVPAEVWFEHFSKLLFNEQAPPSLPELDEREVAD